MGRGSIPAVMGARAMSGDIMVKLSRRQWLAGGGAAVVTAAAGGYLVWGPKPAPIGFEVTADELALARALLARHPSVDAHAHPGRTFVDGAEGLAGLVWLYARLGTFEKRTIKDMQAGGLSASAFAAVSDFQVLGLQGEGLTARRDFAPGEAWGQLPAPDREAACLVRCRAGVPGAEGI